MLTDLYSHLKSTRILRTLTKFEKCQGGALQFEPGEAGAEAAKLKKFSDAGGSQIQWPPDAGRFKLCERSQYKSSRFKKRFITSAPKIPLAVGSFQPPRYFSRGEIEADRRKNPVPIWYLFTESFENPIAQAIPHNAALIRSLCKGRGYLRQNKLGFIYLDVDNLFIVAMTPYLRAQGLAHPPYFNVFSAPEGAHIPVIPTREAEFHYLNECKEIDQEFSFEIEGLYSLKPDTWPEVEEVWFFKVRSPELEALRRKYFLTARPNGHDFHITVAVKRLSREANINRPGSNKGPFLRINPAFIAA